MILDFNKNLPHTMTFIRTRVLFETQTAIANYKTLISTIQKQ